MRSDKSDFFLTFSLCTFFISYVNIILDYVMHPYILQKVKKVFPLAEEIKSKLKKKYTEEEQKRQVEEVCIQLIVRRDH